MASAGVSHAVPNGCVLFETGSGPNLQNYVVLR
jgi:hypothetical protein